VGSKGIEQVEVDKDAGIVAVEFEGCESDG